MTVARGVPEFNQVRVDVISPCEGAHINASGGRLPVEVNGADVDRLAES
jgi:hypothetical protein